MSSLYRDAIADARKLREAAEQNAKNRIIDAVTPKLRQLIEAQINEEDDLLDDDMASDTELVSTDDFVDLLQDEEPDTVAPTEPMDFDMGSMDIESDGLGSLEIQDDSADISLDMDDDEDSSSEEDETNVNINITVEGKRNYLLRHRAIRLVKALSEAKTRTERNKIRKELNILREGLIITENSQNKRLANNLSVILKETNMRRKSRSWLFEGDDELEMNMDDASDESGDETIEIDAAKLEDALGLDPGTLAGETSDDADLDMDLGDDAEEESEEDAGDETYEYGGMKEGEADELDQCETDEKGDEADEIIEVNEAMLRRALRVSRSSRSRKTPSSRLSEARRRRMAARRRRRRLAENDAASAAPSFGGGKAEKEMFVDVDENTLLNALAEELGGGEENSSSAAGSASAKAGDFGGGSAKGDVFEARAHRRTKKALNETKKELKESNLFNAKLLFVTKLMQQHKLNNKQQRAIIEAMDNAKTQREAKLLFTSLNESLNKKTAKLNESKKNTINESRNAYSNRSLQSGQAPRGNGVELDRWAVLAGIKK